MSVNKDISVVFVLGGPGVGKGTQCSKLVKDFKFKHLSAGDLLREEQNKEGSQYSQIIRQHIKDGTIVPQEITIQLLKKAIIGNQEEYQKFLIDGFPRKMDQAVIFEEEVIPAKLTIFFDCSKDVMLERLLERSKTSGREDDNLESIEKRFDTFVKTSVPVIEYLDKSRHIVKKIDCSKTVDEIYADVKKAMKDII
ncbi:UMP-CMP kinase [Hanseniaspora valbyensis NRRL Y-1626]|uniref:Uridylate kinase n=1 Tax=Hanseniaspora valbyensis NRRL Y-1626 TaxID=766949 RepID=A0A1B7TAM2_9ASCO|nr:UMP-CMP kinase [Hanseniaspora valbyensis NRRL Y-1626]